MAAGEKLNRDDPENFAHEITITLDQDQCVNFYRSRDYCPDCMTPVWDAINLLIKADPDLERDRDYDELDTC